MSCKCCFGPAGDNIILEVVTMVLAFCFLLLLYLVGAGGGAALDKLSNIGLIIACFFGIVSVKKANYGDQIKIVLIGPLLAVFVFIMFILTSIIKYSYLELQVSALADAEDRDKQIASIVTIAFMCSYDTFGIGSSLILAIKHFRIIKKRNEASHAGPDGDNIILEIVTIVLALLFLLLILLSGSEQFAILDILTNIALVVTCIYGIVSVKLANYSDQIKWIIIGPILAVLVFISFISVCVFVLITMLKYASSAKGTRESDARLVSVVLLCIYVSFGLTTSLALAIKHFGIIRKRRQFCWS